MVLRGYWIRVDLPRVWRNLVAELIRPERVARGPRSHAKTHRNGVCSSWDVFVFDLSLAWRCQSVPFGACADGPPPFAGAG